jgi:hypothetical protein
MTLRRSLHAALAAIIFTVPSAGLFAQTIPGHQPDEAAAVLAALDEYMLAISANDLVAMDSQQTKEGMTYRARRNDDGRWVVQAEPNLYWVSAARADSPPQRERYWQPTVLVRGPIAVVWAPYEFWISGETSHCGVDVFSFVKTDGAWRVSNSMWTVEPEACDELRPGDPAMIRPPGE